MSPNSRPALRWAFLPLAAALLAGCAPATEPAAATSPTAQPGTSAPESAAVFQRRVDELLEADRRNPDAVAEAFAALSATWDTTTDRTETAAVLRATPLMTPELAGRIVEPERNASQGLWNQLAPLRASSVAAVQPAGPGEAPPADTQELAYRSHQVQWDWKTPDGLHLQGPGTVRNIHLALTQAGGKWSVADYTTEELPAPTGSQQDAPRKEANE